MIKHCIDTIKNDSGWRWLSAVVSLKVIRHFKKIINNNNGWYSNAHKIFKRFYAQLVFSILIRKTCITFSNVIGIKLKINYNY